MAPNAGTAPERGPWHRGTDEKDSIMSVKCLLVEPQGSHQVIIFKIDGKIAKLVISGETKIKSGDTFFINFKQEKILFFNYESHKEI